MTRDSSIRSAQGSGKKLAKVKGERIETTMSKLFGKEKIIHSSFLTTTYVSTRRKVRICLVHVSGNVH